MTARSTCPEAPAGPARAGALRDAVAFLLLATALSWTPWLAVVVTAGDPGTASPAMALWMLGGLGPAAAAALVVAARHRRRGLSDLARGLRRWRLGRWYLLPGFFLWAVAFGGLEEIGWRGCCPVSRTGTPR